MIIRLKEFRDRLGLTLEEMEERSGFSKSQLSRWERGRGNIPSERLPQLAEAYNCDVSEIFSSSGLRLQQAGPTLNVKGKVAAGVWREVFEEPEEEWKTYTGRLDVSIPLEHRFGLVVEGDSMNIVYPHGTILDCVSVFGGAEIASGKRVIVLRQRDDLELEATVKEFFVDEGGRQWLVPRSNNPMFQTPIAIDEDQPGIIECRIIAVVVASIRPE